MTPIPRDEHASMEQDEAGKEEDSPGYSTPQEAVGMTTATTHRPVQPAGQSPTGGTGQARPLLLEEARRWKQGTHTRPPGSQTRGAGNRKVVPRTK